MKQHILHHLETVDSTNEEARRRVAAAESFSEVEDHVIIAQTQTKGRGRLGRRWYSPPGNLYMTIIKRPRVPLAELSKISLVVGVAIRRVLKKYLSDDLYLALKWPNDVLVNRMKLGGILVETDSYPSLHHHSEASPSVCDAHNTFCFIGIGVNLSSSPDLTAYPSCALLDFCQEIPEIDGLAQQIASELDNLLHVWAHKGFEAIREEWLWTAYGLGKPVCARAENGFQVYGRFVTLSQDGAVVVTDDIGTDHLVRSSEITYLV
jgi:BirA family biotin operon repressor/biotin-[acetyl-CoA-carboxylase] ligase